MIKSKGKHTLVIAEGWWTRIAGMVSLKGIQHGVLRGAAGGVMDGENQHAR